MITNKQSINLGMVIHLMLSSLKAGVNLSRKVSWRDTNSDNLVTIDFTYHNDTLTIHCVTINGYINGEIHELLQNMFLDPRTNNKLDLSRCHIAQDSSPLPIDKIVDTNGTIHRAQPLHQASASLDTASNPTYWRNVRTRVATQLFQNFLSEYASSTDSISDKSDSLAELAVSTADVLIKKLNSPQS